MPNQEQRLTNPGKDESRTNQHIKYIISVQNSPSAFWCISGYSYSISVLLMKIWGAISMFKLCSQTSNIITSVKTTQTNLGVILIKWLISISVYVNFICFWGLLQRLFLVCRKVQTQNFKLYSTINWQSSISWQSQGKIKRHWCHLKKRELSCDVN